MDITKTEQNIRTAKVIDMVWVCLDDFRRCYSNIVNGLKYVFDTKI